MIKLKQLLLSEAMDNEEDFLKHHYTGYISPDAYSNYEKSGGLSWLGNKSKYPIVLDTKQHGQFSVEYRQTGNKCIYVKYETDDSLSAMRDENGKAIYLTPEEVKTKGYPEFDTTVVAFINDEPIGLASDEFGAVGVWVEKRHQKLGIGTELLKKHVDQRPSVKSGKYKIGQMTYAGQLMTKSYFRKMAKQHGDDWFEKLRVK